MHKQYYPALDETLYSTVLPNGLTVMVVPKPGFTKKQAYFATDFGSVHTHFTLEGKEYTVPAGVAHYLEHKLFELPDRDVTAEFAAMGAMVNAFTSYDITAYFFSCTERFDDCLRLLLEFVSTPWVPEESVERERGIIDQEIGMNADDFGTQVFEQLMELMYETHPIRVPILGDHDSIRQISPQVLDTCHRAFYNPGNMLLCVVGDVDPESVAQMALQVLGEEKRPMGEKLPLPEVDMTCPRALGRRSMEVVMPNFCLGFKCEPLGKGREAIVQEFVADMACEVLFGEASPLYLRMYESGIIDSSFGGGFETSDGCALINCGGDSYEPEAVRDAILEEAARIVREGVDEVVLRHMKRSAMGRRIRNLDSFDSTCFRLCAYGMTDFDYFRFPEIYDAVTAAEVQAFLARTILPERCSLSIIDPIKEEI